MSQEFNLKAQVEEQLQSTQQAGPTMSSIDLSKGPLTPNHPYTRVERITKEENRKRQLKSRKSPDSTDQGRLDKLEAQISKLTDVLTTVIGGRLAPQEAPSSPSLSQTQNSSTESYEEEPEQLELFEDVSEEDADEPFTQKVLGWIEAKDVLKGFRRHLNGLHKRVRFDEWTPEFREIFGEKFEQFVRDEKFVRRVSRVIRTFPDGQAVDEAGVGTFAAVLAGFLAMYCAFTDIEKQYE